MKKIIISLENLRDAFLNRINAGIKLPDLIADLTADDDIDPYFGESQNWDMLNAACGQLFHFDGTTITLQYNPNNGPFDCNLAFKPIHAFSDWVARSYDNENYPWENNAWEDGYCSGNDDVDYNSSYLDCCIAFIELYLVDNKLTYREFTTYLKD